MQYLNYFEVFKFGISQVYKMFLVESFFVMTGSDITKKSLEKILSFSQDTNYIFKKILSKCLKLVSISRKIKINFGNSTDWNPWK